VKCIVVPHTTAGVDLYPDKVAEATAGDVWESEFRMVLPSGSTQVLDTSISAVPEESENTRSGSGLEIIGCELATVNSKVSTWVPPVEEQVTETTVLPISRGAIRNAELLFTVTVATDFALLFAVYVIVSPSALKHTEARETSTIPAERWTVLSRSTAGFKTGVDPDTVATKTSRDNAPSGSLHVTVTLEDPAALKARNRFC
jgi:hypothetical protein